MKFHKTNRELCRPSLVLGRLLEPNPASGRIESIVSERVIAPDLSHVLFRFGVATVSILLVFTLLATPVTGALPDGSDATTSTTNPVQPQIQAQSQDGSSITFNNQT